MAFNFPKAAAARPAAAAAARKPPSMFEQVAAAQIFKSGQWLDAGFSYIVHIDAVKYEVGQKNFYNFIPEFTVIASDNDKQSQGYEGSWVVGMDKGQPALGNIKNFLEALTNGASSTMSKEDGDKLWDSIVGEENAAAGTLVFVKTHAKGIRKPKEGGATSFTAHVWRPLTEQEQADAEAAVALMKAEAGVE